MNTQLQAELLKQRSTRTSLYLVLALVGLVALAVALHVVALGADRLSSRTDQLDVFQVGTRLGMIFAALAGATSFTAEIRHGTIRPTFLVTPRRGRVVAAKLAISAASGLAFGLLAEGLTAGATVAAFAMRGIDGQLSGGDYVQLILGGAGAAALWGIIGLAVGLLVREQVGTLVGVLAWVLVVETLLLAFVPTPTHYLPATAGTELAGNVGGLAAGYAAALLVAYAGAGAAAGWLVTERRDVA